jgi:hypothetical protein
MSKSNLYTVEVQKAQHILQGQLELYKIQFAETNNNKYLQVMNDLHQSLETIKRMDKVIRRLTKENRQLKNK